MTRNIASVIKSIWNLCIHDVERIAGIAKHIFEHHEQHVHPQGKDIYTALFVDKIQALASIMMSSRN